MNNYEILAYRGTFNLGDAIQSIALSRLLATSGYLSGVYRDELDTPINAKINQWRIVNGWLGEQPSSDPRTLYAGVYLGKNQAYFMDAFRVNKFPIGTRDPYTQSMLTSQGICSHLVGCVTMTLPRYTGPRKGVLYIDGPTPPGSGLDKAKAVPKKTQIIGYISWSDQWRLGIERLKQIETAELVYTNRLHIALPCLAFGTPVYVSGHKLTVEQKQRFSILEAIGFKFGKPCQRDLRFWKENYIKFLSNILGVKILPGEPVFPRVGNTPETPPIPYRV